MSTAIKQRDHDGIKGFLMYEFNRAICGINLGHTFETIVHDIQLAAQHPTLREILKTETTVTEWAQKNNYDLTTLQKKVA